LLQNYPNPFNPATKIEFKISVAGPVHLKIYDILGREVSTLINEEMQPGSYAVDFDASNLASGIYFYTLTAGDPSLSSHRGQAGQSFTSTKKMILLK
jgi:hypothetical protein